MGSLFGVKTPEDKFIFDDIPATLSVRGTYAPLLQGTRRLPPIFCWAGDRFVTSSESKAGGKGSGAGGGEIRQFHYFESGMHVICVGPAKTLLRITQNGDPIMDTPINSTTSPSGTTVTLASGEGSFTIYWGEIDQPVDTTLATSMGVNSRWPYLCYVYWNPKALGSSANWPSLEYEIEAISDQASSSSLSGVPLELTGGINPLHSIDNILTAPFPHGCGIDDTKLDLSSLAGMESDLTTEDIGFSVLANKGITGKKALTSIFEDLGCMITKIDGVVGFKLIRTETPSLTISSDMWCSPYPTEDIILKPLQATDTVFAFKSEDHAYSDVDILLPNDSASSIGYMKPVKASISNAVTGTVAQKIANRREPEAQSSMATHSVNVTREARALRPGDLVILDGHSIPIRIFETIIVANTNRVTHKAYSDLYSTSIPTETQDRPSEDTPQDDPNEDTLVTYYELPASFGVADIAIIPLRVRANDQVKGATIWLSANGTSYTQVANDTSRVAGGVLLDAININDHAIIESGPTFTIEPLDIDSIQDLSGDEEGWRSGNQLAVINDELFHLRNVSSISPTVYRLEGLIRARSGTEKATHSTGSEVYILSPSEVVPIISSFLIPGASISMKAQPYTDTKAVELVTVTPITKTIRALYLKPTPVLNFRGNHFNSYVTGGKIEFTWDYRVINGEGSAANEQLAGTAVGPVPTSDGTFQIVITGGRTVTFARGVKTWTYYNTDILTDHTTEPAAIEATIIEITGSYQSDAVVISIAKNSEAASVDTTPPTPDPSTWAGEPVGTAPTEITMTASTATDASGVEYYFECLENASFDSSWQDSSIYQATGLLSNTIYTFRTQSRDKSSNQNETDWSSSVSATTQSPNISDSPSFNDVVFSLSGSNTVWTAGTVLYQGIEIAIPEDLTGVAGLYVYWPAGENYFLGTNDIVTALAIGNFPRAVNNGVSVQEIKEGFSISVDQIADHLVTELPDAGDLAVQNTVSAAQVITASLAAIQAVLGTVSAGFITSSTLVGNTIKTATSGRRIQMDSDGIVFISTDATGKYGSFKYGDGTKYGAGFLCKFYNLVNGIPFFVQNEQTVADIHLYDRTTDPSGAAEEGEIAMVQGQLRQCSVAGTPGTWEDV